eukprot:689539-Pyramimonas_sp.AAC.1
MAVCRILEYLEETMRKQLRCHTIHHLGRLQGCASSGLVGCGGGECASCGGDHCQPLVRVQ